MDVSRKRILISIIFSFPLLSSLAKRLQKFSLSHSLARSLALSLSLTLSQFDKILLDLANGGERKRESETNRRKFR